MSNWGIPNRPKISNRVENRPIDNEGTDGDVQIKGTGLGAKLFAKWSGRWWDVPLSIDGVTKIGITDSDYLSIDRDSVDIFSNSIKVASFGETTTVKDINLTGRIDNIDGAGNNIIIGQDNPSTSDNTTGTYFKENVIIGSGAGSEVRTDSGDIFTLNVAIGFNAMNDIDPVGHSNDAKSNVAVGHGSMLFWHYGLQNTAIGAGALKTTDANPGTGSNNIGIGYTAGGNITSGSGNVVIGDADVSHPTGDRQLIIASGGAGSDVTWITGNSSGYLVGLNVTGEILCGTATVSGGGGFYCTKNAISGQYAGKFHITNQGGALEVLGASTDVDNIMKIYNTSDAWTGGKKLLEIHDYDNADDNFLIHTAGGNSGEDGADDINFHVTVGGVLSSVSANTSLTDYAEFFESKDGSAFAFGSVVTLDGDKIKLAEEGDAMLGVVRPNNTSSIVGGSNMQWGGRYKKDDFGVFLRKEIEVFEVESIDDDGQPVHTTYEVGKTDIAIPDGVKTIKQKVKIEADNYDSSIEWIPREDRDEWNVIGLLGQVQILKGQPVASSWKKMKSITDSLDLYYIFPCAQVIK